MALQKDFKITKSNFDGELVARDAYCRVESISGSKKSIQAELKIYVGSSEVESVFFNFEPDLSGANFIQQAYEHIKKQPAFQNAKDC